jgi:dipeptidyl aminopeptidase/acylaminoacyl peptidase
MLTNLSKTNLLSSLTKIKTKIMILHAEDDFTVPIEQSEKVSNYFFYV